LGDISFGPSTKSHFSPRQPFPRVITRQFELYIRSSCVATPPMADVLCAGLLAGFSQNVVLPAFHRARGQAARVSCQAEGSTPRALGATAARAGHSPSRPQRPSSGAKPAAIFSGQHERWRDQTELDGDRGCRRLGASIGCVKTCHDRPARRHRKPERIDLRWPECPS